MILQAGCQALPGIAGPHAGLWGSGEWTEHNAVPPVPAPAPSPHAAASPPPAPPPRSGPGRPPRQPPGRSGSCGGRRDGRRRHGDGRGGRCAGPGLWRAGHGRRGGAGECSAGPPAVEAGAAGGRCGLATDLRRTACPPCVPAPSSQADSVVGVARASNSTTILLAVRRRECLGAPAGVGAPRTPCVHAPSSGSPGRGTCRPTPTCVHSVAPPTAPAQALEAAGLDQGALEDPGEPPAGWCSC